MGTNKLLTWDKLLSNILSLPAAKVDRNSFLKKAFLRYGDVERLQHESPVNVYGEEIVESVAKSVVNYRLRMATLVSFATGLPGGFTILATIPADIVQQYYHLLIAVQELAYIYGFPSLMNENGEIDETSKHIITLFIGVAFGIQFATKIIKKLAQELAKQVANKVPKIALTKYGIYNIAKQAGKWIGISITKASTGKAASKIVPLLGGIISGGLTYVTFKPMLKKVHEHFQSQMHTYQKLDQSKNFSSYFIPGSDIETDNYSDN